MSIEGESIAFPLLVDNIRTHFESITHVFEKKTLLEKEKAYLIDCFWESPQEKYTFVLVNHTNII